MLLDFWFDPACPWCWLTSRWLEDVRSRRGDVDVRWHGFSLAAKNSDVDIPERYRRPIEATIPALRVIAALDAAGRHDDIGALYRELGRQIHNEDREVDFDLGAAADAAGVDADALAASGDESLDAAISSSMAEALDMAGDDSGVPIIAFPAGEGRSGFFGPVIIEQPAPADADRLFESVVGLATLATFTELKRARTTGPSLPDRI